MSTFRKLPRPIERASKPKSAEQVDAHVEMRAAAMARIAVGRPATARSLRAVEHHIESRTVAFEATLDRRASR